MGANHVPQVLVVGAGIAGLAAAGAIRELMAEGAAMEAGELVARALATDDNG